MRNIAEFSRLFRIPIPHHGHLDYYIETLARSPRYRDLPETVQRFHEFENEVDGKVADVKMRTMKRLVETIRDSKAHRRFTDAELAPRPRKKDRKNFQAHLDDWFLSIDI